MTFLALKLLLSGIFGGIGRFLASAFTFLTTKPGVYVLIMGLGAGVIWYSGHEGYKRAQADDKAAYALSMAKAMTLAADNARKEQASLDKDITADAEAAALARGRADARTIIITKEIPKYVTVEVDRTFPVPCSLYRVLRAAADHGADPATVSLPAGLTDVDSCPIAASDIAENGVAIDGLYYDATAQIAGLQDLVRTLAKSVSK